MERYLSLIESNVPNKTYMYRKGVNMLVDNQNIGEFELRGWVIGFFKPYIKFKTEQNGE